MKRLLVAAALAWGAFAATPVSAQVTQNWKNPYNSAGFPLNGLPAPTGTGAPVVNSGHTAGSFPASTSGLLVDIACGGSNYLPLWTGSAWTCTSAGALISIPGLSLLGTTTTSSGPPAAITATGPLQVMQVNAAGTGIGWATLITNVYADGIATGTTQLASVAAANLTAGTVAYVASVGDFFSLRLSSLATTATTVIAASGKAGYQWVRLAVTNIGNAAQTTWVLDPSGTCNDENSGASGHALCTFAELARRLNNVAFPAGSIINFSLLSSSVANDNALFNFDLRGSTLFITGTMSAPVYSGTTTSFTAMSTTPAADDNELVDSSIPTSFTASGLMASGLIFVETSSNRKWFAAKDLGSKTLRTSAPNLNGTLGALTPGNAYTVRSLPDIYALGFNTGASTADGFVFLRNVRIHESFTGAGNVVAENSSFAGASATTLTNYSVIGCSFDNPPAAVSSPTANPAIWQADLIFGSGASSIVSFAPGNFQLDNMVFQGTRIAVGQQSKAWAPTRMSFYDVSGVELILVRDQSELLVQTGGIGGTGNSSEIIQLLRQAQTYYEGTLTASGVSSASSSYFVVAGVSYPLSALPIVDVNGGDRIAPATTPLTAGIVTSNGSGFSTSGQLTGPVTTTGGSLATTLNLGTGGIIGTLPLNDVAPPTGTGIATVTSSAWDATATTVSTGLTRNSGNLTADLSTGKGGGQSVVGGTATTDTLTIKATSATPASGAKIYMQTAFGNDYYDPVVGSWALGIGSNPISFFKSGAQAVYKSNGDYSTGTSDAHLFNLQTNGTTAISIDSSQGVTVPSLGGGGTLCVQVDNAGKLTVAAGACSSTSGITQLTGPVTAGPGSGSQATAINLGGGSITGTLALANEGAPTGTGFAHVASGAWDSAARAVDLSGADATGTLAAGHFPALTGPVTTTAGSLATSLNLGAGGITGQLPSTDVAGNANGVAYFNAIGELEGDPTLFSWDDSAKHLKLSTDNGSPFAGTTAGSILEFNNSNTGVGQTLMVWTDSTGTPDAAWIEAIGIVYFYTPGSQGFQVLNSIDNSVPIAGFGGTGLYLYGQGSGMGIGTVTSSAALEIGGSTSNTAILLSQAVTQNIAKVGGGLGILTTDAHSVVIGTNGTARFTIDSSGNETMSSLATGIVKSTSGTLGNASSSDITGAISWPTGILAGDSSSLTTVTIGFSSTTSGLDYAGTTLSGVAFVASGASHAQGMVPDPGSTAGTSRYLREDGWHAVHSAGMTVPYYMNGIANSTLFGSGGAGGWIQPGTSASISTLHIEAPIEYAVEQYRVVINVMLDTISAGSVTCAITKNGGGTSASATFAAGATGVFDSGLLNTSGAAAGDTFGVLCSSSSAGATGSVTAFVEMFLY